MKISCRVLGAVAALALAASACGGSTPVASSGDEIDRPTVAVTTSILGDVVENIVGDQVLVETIMPLGADPHDFQPSAQQVASIRDADVVIVNGGDFEEGLLDVIESAESDGVPVYEANSVVDGIEFGSSSHDDHDDDEHGDEHEGEDDHDDEHEGEDDHDDGDHEEHGHDGVDPHFFTDPVRMATAVEGVADFLIANVDGIDADAVRSGADGYVSELNALDEEVTDILAGLSDEQRVLVTNHEVFGYFADRYEFEVVGTVIPSGTTADGANAAALAELAEIVADEGVPAIFSDTSSSDELVQTLADEVGAIDVVDLFSESLGDSGSGGGTYVDMVRTNATRIADALAG